MNLNDLFNEEKVRLDPKCWTGKKIGNPKTKMKGGVRVNNCVPAESVEEAKISTPQELRDFQSQADYGGEADDARDQYGNLKRSTRIGRTIDIGGVSIPDISDDAFAAGLGSVAAMGGMRNMGGMKGMFGKPRDLGTTSRNIATQRNVGGEAIPSLGQSGKVVTSPAADRALTKLGGKNVDTGPGPTVKSGSTNVQLDPVADVPAYVRQGKPDPVTTPVGKPKIIIRPGETMNQAMQRAKDEQEFGKFLQGQGGQKFGKPSATQTSDDGQVPTIKLPNGQTIPDPARVSPSGQYGHLDKIARDDERAVDAMVKKARENAQTRDAAQANKEKQLGLEPGSLRPRSQWEQERAAALRSEEQKLGLPPGSLNPKPTEPKKPTTPPAKKSSTLGKIGKGLGYAAGAYGAAELGSQALDQVKEAKPRKEPEVDYDAIDHDKSVARLRHLAGIGPMKTVWDPAKRQYRNMPTAQQPKK